MSLPALLLATPANAAVTDTDPSFQVDAADLRFILKQIKISEAHANDGNLLCADPNDTSGTCVPNPLLPWGVRTVDGSYNNLMPGQSHYGSADQPFPRLLPEYLRQAEAPQAPPAPQNAAESTAVCDDPATTCYAQEGPGHFVYDSEPRVISNLIVDQSTNNPAAVEVGAELEGTLGLTPGGLTQANGDVFIPNLAPDEGLSAPFNSWMTIFGQFFDHGLDLVNKGGNGTVIVPLKSDDPLYVEGGRMNFMAVTRATPDADGNHNNQTTPFVDQNQTYTSHPAHQVFLREYTDASGLPKSTGKLLDGVSELESTAETEVRSGLANWNEIKAQAANVLGIQLTDADVLNVPIVVTDLYGQFTSGPNGYPQLMTETGPVEGDPAAPVAVPANVMRTDHAFLDDIAHNAVPGTFDPDGPTGPSGQIPKTPDTDTTASSPADPTYVQEAGTYDDELLGEHFITGDGRGNENIGLMSVHHVFHAEHNRLADDIDNTIQTTPLLKAAYEAADANSWGYGARLFQAARYVTEMEYQHLVFEEFARTLSPTIDPAPFNESTYHSTIDPAIPAEFAHAVYRFGHSMLTDTVPRRGFGTAPVSLLDGFLNPVGFTNNGTLTPDQAAGSVVNGLVAQTGNGIDEFVSSTLRNSLLGLPLDLATINMARAREAGVPPLQTVRAKFYADSGNSALQPYADWEDFGAGLKHPQSLRNFIAAYAIDDPAGTMTLADRRTAADAFMAAPANMQGSQGLDEVDLWVGGLAERGMPFGGMLGSTFNEVFERTLENLQNGDRFYYLNRNIGLNLFHQLEANSFSALVQRTTAASEVPTNIFASQDTTVFDMETIVPAWEADGSLPTDMVRMANGTYRYRGDDHIQMHGLRTADDKMRASIGDDALWGYGGNDRIEGEAGNDQFVGGAGDDILTDLFGDDNIKGGPGNDAIHAGPGFDLIHGGAGRDFVVHGQDDTQTFAGQGNDFLLGGAAHDIFAGNEGDDWIEGGSGSDLLQGDNSNGFQDDPFGGNDVLISGPGNDDYDSEGGDDIIVADPGTDRHEGMLGFDWVTHKNDPNPAQADMDNTIFQPPSVQNMRDRYDLVEALSGWRNDDHLYGVGAVDIPPSILGDEVCAELGRPVSDPNAPETPGCTGHELTQAHLYMVAGLRELLGGGDNPVHADRFMVNNTTNDLLIGGAGNDVIEGRGGDDFIDGSAWLNVQLEVGGERYDSMSQIMGRVFADPQTLNPGDITVIREILTVGDPGYGAAADGVNTAVYSGDRADYHVTENGDGTWTVAHEFGAGADGSDILRNIQQVRFGTGAPVALETLVSNAAGEAVLTLAADLLSVDTTGITDPDGPDPLVFSFQWEESHEGGDFGAIEGATEPTLPVDGLRGFDVRVIVSYTDSTGRVETVISNTLTVPTVEPGAPTNVTATANASGATVTWTPPVDDGGSPITGYKIQVVNAADGAPIGDLVVIDGAVTSGDVTGLANDGTSYAFKVLATNAVGDGALSEQSNTVTPAGAASPPGAPTIGTAVAGNRQATVNWSAPTNNGGTEILEYEVRVVDERDRQVGGLHPAAGTATSLVVTGLNSNGRTYRFQVRARNASGLSAYSALSNSLSRLR